MELRLHTRLLLSLLVLFLICFILLGTILFNDAKEQLSTFRETQAKFQAQTLAEGSLDGLVSEDFELLERWVASSLPSEEYAYAALVRTNGQVLTHTDLDLIGESITTLANTSSGSIARQANYKQRPVQEIIYPAIIGDEVLANAHVAYYLDIDPILGQGIIFDISIVLLGSVFLLLVASYIIARNITGPIEQLRESVRNASLSETVYLSGKVARRSDEVGELARTFEEMSGRLVESHEELTASLLSNKAIVDTSTDGIIIIDQNGIIESVNNSCARIFGYKEHEMLGNNVSMLMPEPHQTMHDQYIVNYIRSGKGNIIGNRREVDGLRKDGSHVPLELSVGEIELDGSSKFTGTVRDVTSRYEYEQALILSRDAAESGNKTKTEFLATISHELRTPMNAIIGMLEILHEEELPEDCVDFVNTASTASRQLLGIVENILNFSDLEKEDLIYIESEFSLDNLAKSVIELYESELSDSNISITYELDPELDQPLMSEPDYIRKILIHLVSNALKFTESGEISLKFDLVSSEEDKVQIRIEVTDTGVGISRKDQSKIFDLFTQADGSYTRIHGGVGIGLTLCKKLVDILHGEIGVISEPDKGSTFWVLLNMHTMDNVDGPHHITSKQVAANTHQDNRGKHVLVVEDDKINQRIIVAMLGKIDIESEVANNGKEAVDALKQQKYDLVLMDCQMPVMNGFEATREIRALGDSYESLPIIAFTANAMLGDREHCISAGMNDYLAKPINKEEFENTITSWLHADTPKKMDQA